MRIRNPLENVTPTLWFELFSPKDASGFWDPYITIENLRPL